MKARSMYDRRAPQAGDVGRGYGPGRVRTTPTDAVAERVLLYDGGHADRALLGRLARRRHHLRTGTAWGGELADLWDYLVMAGQYQFCLDYARYGWAMDLADRPKGPSDMVARAVAMTGSRHTLGVLVKTGANAYNLVVEANRAPGPEVALQYRYNAQADKAECLGWEYVAMMVTCPTRPLGGRTCHYKPAGELRDPAHFGSLCALVRAAGPRLVTT